MAKYRKKPVVIEAYQTNEDIDIQTLEGVMHASPGDYIITGVNGETYPCKPDIFAKTYEPVVDIPCSPVTYGMRAPKPGVTITMGGDHKSHEIPDELWKYIDIFVDAYKKYKNDNWHTHPILDAEVEMSLAVYEDDFDGKKD